MKKLLVWFMLIIVMIACSQKENNQSQGNQTIKPYETQVEFIDEEEIDVLHAPSPPPPVRARKRVANDIQVIPPPPPPPPAKMIESVTPEQSIQYDERQLSYNTENYSPLVENEFMTVTQHPLSTFSIDVDRASYSNARRFLKQGILPPKDAIRIEEMINYFDYNYQSRNNEHPYDMNLQLTESPWNSEFQLAHFSLQAKRVDAKDLPPSNLVFLIDVSGSMTSHQKLPLLKSGFNLLIDNLREQDKVSIVVYAGAAGLVLPPTTGSEKSTIRKAIQQLQAGGSTAGGQGIELAYEIALENFLKEGNNRVILATDGDFNVGISSDGALKRLIEEKRKTGIFLSVLGFGTGNYKDNKMEILANTGNGNYAYIDELNEAKKVFVNEFGGTLFTVAKDVKLQVEFNPNTVAAYRLIGYENRMLQNEDFNNDKKDAGEMGAGHSVTAIYEIIPKDVKSDWIKSVDELTYQKPDGFSTNQSDILTVKTRYKLPQGKKSILFQKNLKKNARKEFQQLNENTKLSIAVAEFGLILRDSQFKANANYDEVIKIVRNSRGDDEEGYRSELLQLVKQAKQISEVQAKR